MDKNKKHCCCCDDHHSEPCVENITLPDGRKAERHTTHDKDGNEVVEIFAEEKRPLKLEERIIREREEIVSRETVEKVKDGEVSMREVRSLAPDTPMEVRSRIAQVDHHKVVDGDYVRKEEIAEMVSESVIAGLAAMMESEEKEVVTHHEPQPNPIFNAQSQIAQRVEENKGDQTMINVILVVFVLVQMGIWAYTYFA